MIKPRTEPELELMRQSGQMTAQALKTVLAAVKPGVSLLELDSLAEKTIHDLGGQSSFKTVPGYDFTTCLNINEEVVHGLPRPIKLKEGDTVSVDLGAVYQGWHTDASWTMIVGQSKEPKVKAFLAAGEEAMWNGIRKALTGNRVGDISQAIQEVIEGRGYQVVRSLVGHGVGRELHEDPEIPGFGRSSAGPILQTGMTLAIEAIYTESSRQVVVAEDQWTLSSADGSMAAVFEMTVVVGPKKAEILTDWRQL